MGLPVDVLGQVKGPSYRSVCWRSRVHAGEAEARIQIGDYAVFRRRNVVGAKRAGSSAAPEVVTLKFRLLDRFGDNGLISVLILRPELGQADVLEIESWVMSCRVFGRQLEFEAMNIAVEAARQRGARALIADYIATSKNNVISALYPSLGFAAINETAPTNGVTRWFLKLADYVVRDNHIVRAGAVG